MPPNTHHTPTHQSSSLSSPPSITSDSAATALRSSGLTSVVPQSQLSPLDDRSSEPYHSHSTTQRQPQVVFTRQLWRRSMPNDSDVPSDPRPHNPALVSAETSPTVAHGRLDARTSRRTSSSVSSRSIRYQPSSPSGGSRTPLTPEESPPYRSTRKRTVNALDEDDRSLDSAGPSPAHVRTPSGGSAAQVCICQPDPKIPRPRNAFILYRQHHQAKVIADHPGLANPEISKIIGEQWRNQPAEIKNEWKRLAEEEKVRHQQQYPQYRYQPKRSTGRNSLPETPTSATTEKSRCQKCGGRTVVAPASYSAGSSGRETSPSAASLPPPTPTSLTTPVSRTLPVLHDLTIQSPGSRGMIRTYGSTEMSPRRPELDEYGPASPDSKRRRTNADYPVTMYRAMPPRYAVAPISTSALSPGSHHGTAPPHSYAPNQLVHGRRESLPSLHMMSPPGPMAPPPRPGMGYSQHRLSQGHTAHDRSLTLPPLQTGATSTAAIAATTPAAKTGESSRSARDVIMSLPLSLKLEVLRQIAPPATISKSKPRGPFIAVEGDDAEAVKSLAQRLMEMLNKEGELNARIIDPPELTAEGSVEDVMAEYHILAATWLKRSKELIDRLVYHQDTSSQKQAASEQESDAPLSPKLEHTERSDESAFQEHRVERRLEASTSVDVGSNAEHISQAEATLSSTSTNPPVSMTQRLKRPILIAPTYSLRATNFYSCRIPIVDAYGPKEHWQWNATLWRGIIGPDLTVYVRDTDEADPRKAVEQSDSEKLFMVKRVVHEGTAGAEVDSTTMRRVGFEVSEWVRAFWGRGN